jgi:hypothetical protein
MLSIGIVIAFADILPGQLLGFLIMLAIGVPFLYVYLRNREYWWALIPAYAMLSIGAVIPLTSVLSGMLIGSYVMFAIALPFFYVYLRNREYWWALIPSGIMSLIGIGLLMGSSIRYVAPAVLIVLGIFLLGRHVSRDKSEVAPATGPGADKPPSV